MNRLLRLGSRASLSRTNSGLSTDSSFRQLDAEEEPVPSSGVDSCTETHDEEEGEDEFGDFDDDDEEDGENVMTRTKILGGGRLAKIIVKRKNRRRSSLIVDQWTNKPRKELEKHVRWLETERCRLLQLSRGRREQPRSFEAGKVETGFEQQAKSFVVKVNLNMNIDKENSRQNSAEMSFEEAFGISVECIDGQLHTKEFVRNVHGDSGPVENSGHVEIGDILEFVEGTKLSSVEDLERAWPMIRNSRRVALGFCRQIIMDRKANKSMTPLELYQHIEYLESELQYARARYARLDIGALEALEQALEDLRIENRRLRETLDEYRQSSDRWENTEHLTNELKMKYDAKKREFRDLYNQFIDLKGAIRVFVRVRPAPAEHLREMEEKGSVLKYPDERLLALSDLEDPSIPEKRWNFDAVFPPQTTQRRVYEEVEPLVNSVVDGYNACVFAYGPTGSGKTYTMDGPHGFNAEKDCKSEKRGVYYRAAETLFEAIEKRVSETPHGERLQVDVKVSVLEIYQERVRDLLSPTLATFNVEEGETPVHLTYSLDIKQDPKDKYVYVQDATERKVTNANELHQLIEEGKRYRVVGVTNVNERSSRSHMVLIVTVTKTEYAPNSNEPKSEPVRSKLQMIDLAGSERASFVEGSQRLKETGSINKSLAALGDVMRALQKDSTKHIPYRNSKLTSLLRDSLGGSAKTLMMIQVSNLRSHIPESLRTLDFAAKVRQIRIVQENGITVAEKNLVDNTQQINSLKKSNADLKRQCKEAKQRSADYKLRFETEKMRATKIAQEKDHMEMKLEKEKQALDRENRRLEDEVYELQRLQKESQKRQEDEEKMKAISVQKTSNLQNNLLEQENGSLKDRNAELNRKLNELTTKVKDLEKALELKSSQVKDTSKLTRENSALRHRLERMGSSRLSVADDASSLSGTPPRVSLNIPTGRLQRSGSESSRGSRRHTTSSNQD